MSATALYIAASAEEEFDLQRNEEQITRPPSFSAAKGAKTKFAAVLVGVLVISACMAFFHGDASSPKSTSSLDAITDLAAADSNNVFVKGPIDKYWASLGNFEGFCTKFLGVPKEACSIESGDGDKNSPGTKRNMYMGCPPKTEDTSSCVVQQKLLHRDSDKHTMTYEMTKPGPFASNLKANTITISMEAKNEQHTHLSLRAHAKYISTCTGDECDDKMPNLENVKAKRIAPWATKAGFKEVVTGTFEQWMAIAAKLAEA